MEYEQYIERKTTLLNVVAPNVVAFHKQSISKQAIAIAASTGSEYLATKWQGVDFAHRYLNSDSNNKRLWLIMMGIEDPSVDDCEIMRHVMIYFYNHSVDTLVSGDFLKRKKLKAFGNGLNWCKAWVSLLAPDKTVIVKHFNLT